MSAEIDQIRATILSIFESCQQDPSAPFQDDSFLKPLSDWRLRLFFNRIEDHFILYVSWKKRHNKWSLDQFFDYVVRARRARKSSIVGAERAVWESSGCMTQLAIFWIPLLALGIVKDDARAWVAFGLALALLLVSVYFFMDWLRYRRLANRIRALT